MIRRVVWCLAAVLVGMGGVTGCEAGDPDVAPRPSASPSLSPTPAGCARSAPGRADQAALKPGPSAGKPAATTPGDPLVIDAVVLDRACAPAAGAELRVWHTDARGLYGPGGGDDCCFYEARGRTDQRGRFRLETIRPARYPEANAPPAHIHVQVDHARLRAEATIVFALGSPPATVTPGGGPVSVALNRDGAGWRGEATIVLEF